MRFQGLLLPALASTLLSGCYATALAGSAIRSGQRDVDFVLGPGISLDNIQRRQKVAIALNGVNASNGQYVIAAWGGDANASVYSDMLAKEFLRLGYDAYATSEGNQQGIDAEARRKLNREGFDLILVGSLNLAMSSNYASAMVGGEYLRTGVTSATVRGVDPRDGKTLFILSVEYGTAKNAGTVATDITTAFAEAMDGEQTPAATTRAARNEKRADSRSGSEAQAPAPAPDETGHTAETASSSRTGVALPAPRLIRPGTRAAPGQQVDTSSPVLEWEPVDGATHYGVYLRDLTGNRLVLSRDNIGLLTRFEVPDGILEPGRRYRWNIRAFSGNTAGTFASPLYLTR